jgi:hypothetical protein
MRTDTKAQGSSMNVIVVAVIAVLVLLVMTFIFIRGVGSPNENLNNCFSRGGTCESDCEGRSFEVSAKCPTEAAKCCVSSDSLFKINEKDNP